jgi:tetratricopeptide (TPR) repeat protein
VASLLLVCFGVLSALGASAYVKHNQRIATERAEALLQVERLEALREHFTLILRNKDGVDARAALDESVRLLTNRFKDNLDSKANLLLALGDVYVAAGDYQAAVSVLAPLQKDASSFARLTESQKRKWFESYVTSSLRTSKLEEAETQMAAWQQLSASATDANAAELKLAQATLKRLRGDAKSALVLQVQGVQMIDAAADATEVAKGIAHANLGTAYFGLGEFKNADQQYQRALSLWGNEGLVLNDNVLTVKTNQAHILALRGEARAAHARYQALVEQLRARGAQSPAFAALLIGLARTEALTQDVSTALKLVREAKSILLARTGGQGNDMIGALLNELDLLVQNNTDTSAIEHELSKLLKALPDSHPFHVRYQLVQAQRAWMQAKPDLARTVLAAVMSHLTKLPASMQSLQWRAAIIQADLLRLEGQRPNAEVVVQTALDQAALVQAENGVELVELRTWLACLQKGKGSVDEFQKLIAPSHPRLRALQWCAKS